MLNKIMVRKSLKNINLKEIKNKINFGEFRRYSKEVQKEKIKSVFQKKKNIYYILLISIKKEKLLDEILYIPKNKVLSLC